MAIYPVYLLQTKFFEIRIFSKVEAEVFQLQIAKSFLGFEFPDNTNSTLV